MQLKNILETKSTINTRGNSKMQTSLYNLLTIQEVLQIMYELEYKENANVEN